MSAGEVHNVTQVSPQCSHDGSRWAIAAFTEEETWILLNMDRKAALRLANGILSLAADVGG